MNAAANALLRLVLWGAVTLGGVLLLAFVLYASPTARVYALVGCGAIAALWGPNLVMFVWRRARRRR